MAIYSGDQPTGTPAVVNGVHVTLTAAQVKTTQTAANTAYTFTANYTFHWPVIGGTPTSYRKGVTYSLDPALKAALLAAGAPMAAA